MIPLLAVASVLLFGADGADDIDDRAAIQRAIDHAAATGDEVYFPPGTYLTSRAGSAYYCLRVPAGVKLRGAGQLSTTIQQTVVDPGVRLLWVTGADVAIEDLALDGNRDAQLVASEWRHGIFAYATTRLVIRRVTAEHFTGDGIYLYTGATDTIIDVVEASGNARNGLTFGAQVTGVDVRTSVFRANAVQQIDSEPGGVAVVSGVSITGSVLDGTGSNDYALTVSGTSPLYQAHNWRITDNRIDGAVFVVGARDVTLVGNYINNHTTKPSVEISRSSTRVRLSGNDVRATQMTTASVPVVFVVGTAGSGPSDILIAGNRLSLAYERSFGVRAEGAVSVTIAGNEFIGPGPAAPPYSGVYLRATHPDRPFERAVVADNVIRGFGWRAVSVHGNATAKLLGAEISRNAISGASTGISLDDGTGALQWALVTDNTFSDVTSELVNVPSGMPLLTGWR